MLLYCALVKEKRSGLGEELRSYVSSFRITAPSSRREKAISFPIHTQRKKDYESCGTVTFNVDLYEVG